MGLLYHLQTLFRDFWKHHRQETSVLRFVTRLIQWTVFYRTGIRSFFTLHIYRHENKPSKYLTTREYGKVMHSLTPFYYQCLLEDKLVFDRYMKSFGFPLPELLGTIENGTIQWFDPFRKEKLEQIKDYDLDCFVKILTKWGGENVHRLENTPSGMRINRKPAGIDDLRALTSNGIYVLQRTVIQHDAMRRINASSVNTVRMVTIHDGIRARNLLNFVRMGVKNSLVDNITQGGLGCGVNEDGTLMQYGFDGILPVDRHPDSGVVFEGYPIPYYDQALELVRNMHQSFHCFFLIGWDIAISETGPRVIEGNPVGELLYEQLFFPKMKETFLSCAASYRKNREAFIREFVLKDQDKW